MKISKKKITARTVCTNVLGERLVTKASAPIVITQEYVEILRDATDVKEDKDLRCATNLPQGLKIFYVAESNRLRIGSDSEYYFTRK